MKAQWTDKIIITVITALFMTVLAGCGSRADKTDTDTAYAEAEMGSIAEDTINEPAVVTMGDSAGADTTDKKPLSLEDKIVSMQITYRFDDNVETLDGATISGWLTTLADGSVSVNEASAKEYVASLASRHDTFGRNRSFKTHDGSQITVSGGDYGYWMDRVSTRQELISQILTGESAELTPVYYGTAASYDPNNIGNSYVEINIGEQHLWVYKDGQQVNETDFVSGGLFKGNSTPEGTYAITYKERDSTLVGEGYQSSVKYWMPFNGNIGLHDASWRDAFGGHIYYFKGSHGCVNLPSDKAAEIYDQVEKGEAVVVYGSVSKEEAAANLSMEDKATAAQKGYIPMTPDIQAYIYEQQGFDHDTAAALAAAGQAASEAAEQAALAQVTESQSNGDQAGDEQTVQTVDDGQTTEQQTDGQQTDEQSAADQSAGQAE
ncbi:MAG: L,D-transpeptidase/peptidoglycan binding protein [Lachnospiraceae bacterium]|nr:L,D-transpeptidase/peptidoglycan binding protein [Lachnospiraceae bacterium]